jgi:hypothetical protein
VGVSLLAVKSFLQKPGTCSYFHLLTYSNSGGLCGLNILLQNALRLHIHNISGPRCFPNFLWGVPVSSDSVCD